MFYLCEIDAWRLIEITHKSDAVDNFSDLKQLKFYYILFLITENVLYI